MASNMKKAKFRGNDIKINGRVGYLLQSGRPPKSFKDSGATTNNRKIYIRRN